MQCAYAILSSVACPNLQSIPHYLINGTIFEEKKLFKIKRGFWFALQVLCETFLDLRKIERDTIKYVYRSSCKVHVVLASSMRLEFSRQIFEQSSNIKCHENLSVRAELFQVHGQTQRKTDTTKLIVAFRNFANAPKKGIIELIRKQRRGCHT